MFVKVYEKSCWENIMIAENIGYLIICDGLDAYLNEIMSFFHEYIYKILYFPTLPPNELTKYFNPEQHTDGKTSNKVTIIVRK